MKSNIHPPLHPVVFIDTSTGKRFITRSTKDSREKEIINGVKHFVHYLGISSDSHPFFTGQNTFVDTAGRIEKFTKRYGKTFARPQRSRIIE